MDIINSAVNSSTTVGSKAGAQLPMARGTLLCSLLCPPAGARACCPGALRFKSCVYGSRAEAHSMYILVVRIVVYCQNHMYDGCHHQSITLLPSKTNKLQNTSEREYVDTRQVTSRIIVPVTAYVLMMRSIHIHIYTSVVLSEFILQVQARVVERRAWDDAVDKELDVLSVLLVTSISLNHKYLKLGGYTRRLKEI